MPKMPDTIAIETDHAWTRGMKMRSAYRNGLTVLKNHQSEYNIWLECAHPEGREAPQPAQKQTTEVFGLDDLVRKYGGYTDDFHTSFQSAEGIIRKGASGFARKAAEGIAEGAIGPGSFALSGGLAYLAIKYLPEALSEAPVDGISALFLGFGMMSMAVTIIALAEFGVGAVIQGKEEFLTIKDALHLSADLKNYKAQYANDNPFPYKSNDGNIEDFVITEHVEEQVLKSLAQSGNRAAAMHLLSKSLRPATAGDYQQWLEGHGKNGGRVTHAYDYPLPAGEFYVAVRDFEMYPLTGSSAIKVIVPENVKVLGGELGHSNLFFMNGYRRTGWFTPSFSNAKPQASISN